MSASNSRILLMLASLLPVLCLGVAPLFGGGWVLVALVYLTGFAFLADEAVNVTGQPDKEATKTELRFGDIIPVIQGIAHFALLPVAIYLITLDSALTFAERCAAFAAFALYFGIVGTSNAHELIHRRNRLHHHLGKWVYISLMFGHHVTAHLSIHHRYVASDEDPNSARLNESFYHFFRRAWRGSFVKGLAIENQRLRDRRKHPMHPSNPYVVYTFGAAVFLAGAYALTGAGGLFVYFGFALLAQTQLLLSDYVQHYGLRRNVIDGVGLEPASNGHSWNASHWLSSAIMINAPRHSDHHAHPAKPYPDLISITPDQAPELPYSLPAMACLALVPAKWRKVMNPRVAFWQNSQAPATIISVAAE